MVDHTFIYTGAVRKIKEIVDAGEFGDLLYFDSVRINLGLFQRDINVVWDLAPHDLSIMDYSSTASPSALTATGSCHIEPGIENIAYVQLRFADSLSRIFHFNWLSPVKIRRTLIAGSRKMIVYDDIEPTEKVRVYDKGVTRSAPTTTPTRKRPTGRSSATARATCGCPSSTRPKRSTTSARNSSKPSASAPRALGRRGGPARRAPPRSRAAVHQPGRRWIKLKSDE